MLEQLIAARGWTTSDVSRQAVVDQYTVRRWVREDSVPHIRNAVPVARLFGLEDGTKLLKCWGYPEAVAALSEAPENLTFDGGLDVLIGEQRIANKRLARIEGLLQRIVQTKEQDSE